MQEKLRSGGELKDIAHCAPHSGSNHPTWSLLIYIHIPSTFKKSVNKSLVYISTVTQLALADFLAIIRFGWVWLSQEFADACSCYTDDSSFPQIFCLSVWFGSHHRSFQKLARLGLAGA